MFKFLTIEQVIKLHNDLLARTGGIVALTNTGMLEAAIAAAQSGYGDVYFHTDVFEMAAAYAFHIAKNHPFMEGNKRCGLSACLIFLDLNGYSVQPPDPKMLENAMVDIVDGLIDKSGFAELLRRHAVPIEEYAE
jgi:death-on-curing protein